MAILAPDGSAPKFASRERARPLGGEADAYSKITLAEAPTSSFPRKRSFHPQRSSKIRELSFILLLACRCR